MIHHSSPAMVAKQRGGNLSFFVGESSGAKGNKKKKRKPLSDDELRQLKLKSTCRYCKVKGHWEEDCHKKKRDEEPKVMKPTGKQKNEKHKGKSKSNDDDADAEELDNFLSVLICLSLNPS